MKKFFFSHPDVVLAVIALVLLVILIGFFSWGINDVVSELRLATLPSAAQSAGGFDMQGAAKINFHGVSTSTVPSTVPTPSSAVIPTSTVSSTATATTTTSSSLK